MTTNQAAMLAFGIAATILYIVDRQDQTERRIQALERRQMFNNTLAAIRSGLGMLWGG